MPSAANSRDLSRGEETGKEEDFLYHVSRASQLIAVSKNLDACDELERAVELKPSDLKARNLLGLVYFKLGSLDRAAAVYERLVQGQPADSTLRINLGLVHLKAGQPAEAVAQLETAVALAPPQPRTLNYLGLAYAKLGSYDQAEDSFERAGNSAMARKMALKRPPSGTAAEVSILPVKMAAKTGTDILLLDTVAPPSDDLSSGLESSPKSHASFENLAALVHSSAFELPIARPFGVREDVLALRVEGELRTRLTGFLWMQGSITCTEAQRRFRGRAVPQSFGEGPDRLFRLQGHGELALALAGYAFTQLPFAEESAYLLEDVLFAFEESLGYENGSLPGEGTPRAALVHLRGRGQVLVRSPGPVHSVEIRTSEPLQLPWGRLIGWTGDLTPTLFPLQEGFSDRWIRLEGEGWALWSESGRHS